MLNYAVTTTESIFNRKTFPVSVETATTKESSNRNKIRVIGDLKNMDWVIE